MASVWLAFRSDLARRWRPAVGLALLLGLVGGASLTAAAGARRTATAYPRLLTWANAAQFMIIPGGDGLTSAGTGRNGFYAAMARLPQVESMSAVALFGLGVPTADEGPDLNLTAIGGINRLLGVTADRVTIIAGRPFSPTDPRAAMVDAQLAAREHLRPGSTLRLLAVPHYNQGPQSQRVIPLTFRVSAIVRFDDQIVPASGASADMRVLLTPAFTRQRAVMSFTGGDYAGVRLRPGASRAAFMRAATALAARYRGDKLHPGTGGKLGVISDADQVAVTERAIEPTVIALLAFAVLAGVIGLAVVGQLLARQLLLDSVEFPALRALGMTRGGLVSLAMLRAGAATGGGAFVAVAVAVAASPLMPIGPARLAEPSPGVEINVAVLGAGMGTVCLLPLVVLAAFAWHAAARAGAPPHAPQPGGLGRPSSVSRLLSAIGSVTGRLGTKMAFEPGHGRSAVPVRSTLAATIVAMSAVMAALVFGASLLSLIAVPARYGQDWAQEVDFSVAAAPAQQMDRALSGMPHLSGYAFGLYGPVSVAGHTVPAVAIDPVRGGGFVSMLSGRPPVRPDEIALGQRTLRASHLRIGDWAAVAIRGHGYRLKIVGEPVFASISEGGSAGTDLGEGALLPARLLSTAYASPPFAPVGCRRGVITCYSFMLLRFDRGTSPAAADGRLNRALTRAGCFNCASFITDQRPADIREYAGVRDTPMVLSGLLALLAAGALSHVLLTSVRRRRRDLALLKTLGLTRRQVRSVVAWQASALAAAALAAGIPLGLVAGRWSWAFFAGSVGVGGTATIPALVVLLAMPLLLLVANLIAAWPARTAARLSPASILRSE